MSQRARVGVQLAYPANVAVSGTTVLAAALALFGPDDLVSLHLTPSDDSTPTAEQIEEIVTLCRRLAEPYGSLPPLTVSAPADLPPVALSLTITGHAAADARTVLVLAGLGRQLGSAYARTHDPRSVLAPRGGADLAQVDAAAAQLRRSLMGVRPSGPVRIAVIARAAHYWSSLDTVARATAAHPDARLDVVHLTDSNAPDAHADQLRETLAELGTIRDEAWLRAHLRELDVVISADGYDLAAPDGLSSRDLVNAGVRLVLVPYAQALSGDTANAAMLFDLPAHNIAWRVFAASDGQLTNFARYCAAGAAHVRAVGSSKRERLLTDTAAREAGDRIRAHLGSDAITLWNPHFPDDAGLSTFSAYLPTVVEFFRGNPDRGLIVRPHPLLLRGFEHSGGVAGRRLADEFRKICAGMPNVLLDETIDPLPALLAADSMISDLSSLIPEYLALGRPAALLRNRPDLPLNADDAFLADVSTVDTADELRSFLVRNGVATRAIPASPDLGAGRRVVAAILADFRCEVLGEAA